MNSEVMNEEVDETRIKMKRTTTLKIFMDGKETYYDEEKQRKYLASVFDCPELLESSITENVELEKGEDRLVDVSEYVLEILEHNNIDVTKLYGYKKSFITDYTNNISYIWRKIRDDCNIDEKTYISYQYTNSDEINGEKVYYFESSIRTSGETKEEITGIHKENVLKIINHLKEHGVPYAYDCEWSFEGNKACVL